MVDLKPETLVATPGSTVDSGGLAKTPAAKDRTCPFCNAPFTSSSLGRHLALYIKDKNPKPPDDVHDVDEIRKLRGNVTRRQARTSSSKREGSTPSSSKPTPIRDQRSPSTPAFYPNINHTDSGPLRTTLNRPSWQATGVINNLPPVNREALNREAVSTYNKKRNPARRVSVKEVVTSKQDALEERDRGRAAELALREVLGSVRAATYVIAFWYSSFRIRVDFVFSHQLTSSPPRALRIQLVRRIVSRHMPAVLISTFFPPICSNKSQRRSLACRASWAGPIPGFGNFSRTETEQAEATERQHSGRPAAEAERRQWSRGPAPASIRRQ